MIPISTYRFQFHKDFNFDQFQNCIAYLKLLGINTVYASPIFEAVPGSNHGYDGLHPHKINPEIGTIEKLKELSIQLKASGINWLQDIVPNHMAYHTGNSWLEDVLEKGPCSIYAIFFDEGWSSEFFNGRIMAPFLGNSIDEVIERKELKVIYKNNRFKLAYFDNSYPIRPHSYSLIIPKNMKQVIDMLEHLPEVCDDVYLKKEYAEKWNAIILKISALMETEEKRKLIKSALDKINEHPKLLKQLAEEQFYRLCHWQETDSKINYRRFFTVNGLICLNIQNEEVFNAYHEFIKYLLNEGVIQGLRVDHIDGLYDPGQYLQRLRSISGDDAYIVVEKIIEPGEQMPEYWPVQGTTGYDFLGLVNNLFTQKKNQEKLTLFYDQLANDARSIHDQLIEKKSYILFNHMAGELDNLYRYFLELDIVEKQRFATFRMELLKEAIGQFLIYCPVYRYYSNYLPFSHQEYHAVINVLNMVRKENPDLDRAVDILEDVLLKKPPEGNEEQNRRTLMFYQRCMQFTGPLMAKGVEDTLMYSYNRFIGHNEVGDSPESFGISIYEFHQSMIDRLKKWPYALNATSTHDTKRGEDVRARLNVITELADEWIALVKEFQSNASQLRKDNAPDVNDEYFIYQTIAGTFPMPGMEEENFNDRVKEYLKKALREEKVHSNWVKPDTEYEKATLQFSNSLLARDSNFRKLFESFHKKICEYGIMNSLVQLILKCTCPGIPDIYQGCELWDLSMVDPDNRRPVDFKKRINWINEIMGKEFPSAWKELWNERYNGKIKLWLLHNLLSLRDQYKELFLKGDYVPIKTEGVYKDHILAFTRRQDQVVFLIILPLHIAELAEDQGVDCINIDWKDTYVMIPPGIGNEWEHMLFAVKDVHKKSISINHLFKELPFAILKGGHLINERGSGILIHISSLASPFGIGDMGSEARMFAQSLNNSRQKYWQLLPLNPTEQGQGHSPYSSTSSCGGNVLLISPEIMIAYELLSHEDIKNHRLSNETKVNFQEAEKVKMELFDIAWNNYRKGKGRISKNEFEIFKQKESFWLNDFSLYMILKKLNNGKPWFEWEDKYKLRSDQSLMEIAEQHCEEAEKVRFLQFLFNRQWKELKKYCNDLGVKLIGDLPFYISYDSVDVWANKEIFALDDKGNRIGIAGVPPDAFSDDGQLWGMPVFNWDELKAQKYKWWIERLRKNIELFDLIRLDHFRAFAAYWEVPATEQTARNGSWKKGPASDFFKEVKEQLGELPFIAEDLGDIDEPVYELRDEFNLPGMKVLQFAFSENMTVSPYVPHNYDRNYIVYTGTHDNNTLLGWFRQEGAKDRERMQKYLGKHLSEEEVADVFCRMALSSVARIAIIPAQDLLGLDENARMNKPSQAENNWGWRLLPWQINESVYLKLREWTELFNRD